MEVFAAASSAYLAIQSVPLILTPRLIVSLTASEPRRITDLETYLSRSLGLTLLLLSALLLLLTNTLPVAVVPEITAAEPDNPDHPKPAANPYAYPTAVVTTFYHALSAFYLYAQLTYTWNFAFTCGLVGSGFLFCLGIWTVLFGGGEARRSKRTGADKRTSNFPFENKESARAIRKESKAREREDAAGREKERRRSGVGGRTKSSGRIE